jgi:hypothetical protein
LRVIKRDRAIAHCLQRRELEDDVLAGERLVDLGKGVDTVTCRLGFVVEVHLEEHGAIGSGSGSLANDFGWEDEIIENVLVDLCEGKLSRSQLLELTGTTGFGSDDSSFGNDEDWLARELLLELLNEGTFLDDLLELGEHRNWDEDHNALLATTDINLLGCCDVDLSEWCLQLLRVDLEVVQGLCDRLLECGRGSALGLLDLCG